MNKNQKITKAVVTGNDDKNNHQMTERFELVMEDGTSLTDVIADLTSRIETLENPG